MTPRFLLLAILLPLALAQTEFAIYSLTLAVPNQLSIFAGDANGTLTFVKQINTGGDGIPANAGGIGSQYAVIVKDNFIFAVNPSSNSLSMFSINPSDPTDVTLIGTPASTNYDWPDTVTAHPSQDIVCVATSGANNGLRCFTYSAESGLTVISGSDQAFGISLITPPAFHTGPAQISFKPDGSALVISIKAANPPVLMYPFANGQVSSNKAQTPVKGMVPFGFTFDADGTVVLTDAAPNGTFSGIELLSVTASPTPALSFLLEDYFLIENEMAACWIERVPSRGTFIVANAASRALTELTRSGTTITVNGNFPTGNGTNPTDLAVVSIKGTDYVYVQSGGTQILGFALSGIASATEFQVFDEHATGTYGAGLAAYVIGSSSSSSAFVIAPSFFAVVSLLAAAFFVSL